MVATAAVGESEFWVLILGEGLQLLSCAREGGAIELWERRTDVVLGCGEKIESVDGQRIGF